MRPKSSHNHRYQHTHMPHAQVGGCVPSLCQPMSELSARYSAPRYMSVEALLADKEALGLDGVLCAAPHSTHSSVGCAVLEAVSTAPSPAQPSPARATIRHPILHGPNYTQTPLNLTPSPCHPKCNQRTPPYLTPPQTQLSHPPLQTCPTRPHLRPHSIPP